MVDMSELRTIACVEDEPSIRMVLRAALATVGGYEVTTYAGGPEAIAALADAPVDVVLLDVSMPGMDGQTTFRELRALPSCGHTVIIFLTAKARPEERSDLLALGAADVLVKPFDPMTLARQVAETWYRARCCCLSAARVDDGARA
ncbi:MAG TPA: response regulator [Nannocystaceae bacterium]|nr:response regulator [Nannocystaceae bacterium]